MVGTLMRYFRAFGRIDLSGMIPETRKKKKQKEERKESRKGQKKEGTKKEGKERREKERTAGKRKERKKKERTEGRRNAALLKEVRKKVQEKEGREGLGVGPGRDSPQADE